MVDEMADACTLISLQGKRCGCEFLRLQKRCWRRQTGPESVLVVDVTLQLPYTGRCSLELEFSSSHGSLESWNIIALTCDGLRFNAQHNWHRGLCLFQPQQSRNVVHLLRWLTAFLTRGMVVCFSKSLFCLAGTRRSPGDMSALKLGRIVRGLIVLRLFLDPINDGRSDTREGLR